MNLDPKILFIQTSVDQSFRLILNKDWGSLNSNYRSDIRNFLAQHFSTYFSREQIMRLHDLNQRPLISEGSFSVSHCKSLGGFSYSKNSHGFDLEEKKRISMEILRRTCSPSELESAPTPEYLWVAKEACYKAISTQIDGIAMSDLECDHWQSHSENNIYSCRMNSKKALDFGLNKNFIFSDSDYLFGFFFK